MKCDTNSPKSRVYDMILIKNKIFIMWTIVTTMAE